MDSFLKIWKHPSTVEPRAAIALMEGLTTQGSGESLSLSYLL